MHRFKMLWLILLILSAHATNAQDVLSPGGLFPVARFDEEAPEQIDERTKSLNDRGAPSDDIAKLLNESRELDKQSDKLNQNRPRISFNDRQILDNSAGLKANATALKDAISSLEGLQCADANKFNSFRRIFGNLVEAIDDQTPGISPFSDTLISSKTTCEDFKQSVMDIGAQSVDRWVGDVDLRAKRAADRRLLAKSYERWEAALANRKTLVEDSIRKVTQRQSLTDNFVYFIILFGLMAIGCIFVVSRFYTADLQMEWVGSGQVTQFVTVMILLTVITMLGLSKTISGETLGTLLGGVAGYVLAQGVGRAAARDAERARGPIIVPK